MSSNSFESFWSVADLKAKAEGLCVESIEWFESKDNARVVGMDWVSGDVYVIDPDSPDFPLIELAQFDGIDQLFVVEKEGK